MCIGTVSVDSPKRFITATDPPPTVFSPPSETLAPPPSATITSAPTLIAIPAPTRTVPAATRAAQATITAFGTVCEAPAYEGEAGLSPDGQWIAVACVGDNGEVDSHLRVLALGSDADWVIHFADYAHGESYDRNDRLEAFHWSHDGRFLYAASPSKMSGCCWLGDYMLLVRLNLANGQQTEVLNYRYSVVAVDFSFSSSDRYFLYIPQSSRDELFILDLLTWNTRVVNLAIENAGAAGHTLMSPNDEKIVLMVLDLGPYPDFRETASLAVIDLTTGSQTRLLSGVDYDEFPYPVRWLDEQHVLLRDNGEYWLLNVETAELTPTTAP